MTQDIGDAIRVDFDPATTIAQRQHDVRNRAIRHSLTNLKQRRPITAREWLLQGVEEQAHLESIHVMLPRMLDVKRSDAGEAVAALPSPDSPEYQAFFADDPVDLKMRDEHGVSQHKSERRSWWR